MRLTKFTINTNIGNVKHLRHNEVSRSDPGERTGERTGWFLNLNECTEAAELCEQCDCMKLTDTTSGLLGHKDEREEWDSFSSPPHFTRLSTFWSGLREGMGEGEEDGEEEEEEEEEEVESSIHG